MSTHHDEIDTVYICDWLPPDFGAVGQYADIFSRQRAEAGERVVLIGLTSGHARTERETIGQGHLTTVWIAAKPFDKNRMGQRLWWTAKANTRLTWTAWHHIRRANTVLFTGSPPLFLHWMGPAKWLHGRRVIYSISDFHPECAMAGQPRPSFALRALLAVTRFWRRRVDEFEVLGFDQKKRLVDDGIDAARIRVKPFNSPVTITAETQPLQRPAGFEDKALLLYSGNWGVAHDTQTFLAAYRKHHRQGSGRTVLWLNAVGSGGQTVADYLTAEELPFVRGEPVPIDQLAALLITPDAHLITLSDAFVGYVLPSKIYGCIASGKPILYIGSAASDVHALSQADASDRTTRCDVGDADAVAQALEALADRPRQ
ncbi:MAG: hypothetical protein AAGG72_05775 [Pseudomonadota bacterium]